MSKHEHLWSGIDDQAVCVGCDRTRLSEHETVPQASPMTPLTNSIEETLESYHKAHSVYTATGQPGKATICLMECTQSIITKVKESLPEKREVTTEKTYEGYDRTNPRHRYVTGVDVGWNQAVRKMEDKLG